MIPYRENILKIEYKYNTGGAWQLCLYAWGIYMLQFRLQTGHYSVPGAWSAGPQGLVRSTERQRARKGPTPAKGRGGTLIVNKTITSLKSHYLTSLLLYSSLPSWYTWMRYTPGNKASVESWMALSPWSSDCSRCNTT